MIIIEPANLLATLGTPSRKAVSLPKRELSSFLALAAQAAGIKGRISVLLTDDDALRELNRAYRKMDKTTDVLSFPAGEPVGDRRRTECLEETLRFRWLPRRARRRRLATISRLK